MATHDLTRLTEAHPYAQMVDRNRARTVTAYYDASKKPAAAADVMKLIDVPADSLVLVVRYQVKLAEGAVLTFDVGDAAAPTQFATNANGNDAATEGVSALTAAKYYGVADTLNLVLDAAASKVQILLTAVILELAPAH